MDVDRDPNDPDTIFVDSERSFSEVSLEGEEALVSRGTMQKFNDAM